MLSTLYIQNVAVIAKAAVEFQPGLNVFTGETGAGKSILISAINSILGERISKDLVRSGTEKAVITALFTDLSNDAKQAVLENGFSFDEEENALLISREITAEGKSTCRVGGRPATVSVLKSITPRLIAIHGQHDTQQLLSQSAHMQLLDLYGDLTEQKRLCAETYHSYLKTKAELENLQTDERVIAQKMDLLQHQVDEILDAELEVGEEDELRSQQKLLSNSIEIGQTLGSALTVLEGYEDIPGLLTQCYDFQENVRRAGEFISEASSMGEQLTDIYYRLEGFGADLRRLMDVIETDPNRLEQIEQRLDLIYGLKKKYGDTIEEIIAFGERAEQEMEELKSQEVRSAKLEQQANVLLEKAQTLAEQLSQKRKKAAAKFTKQVEEELAFLDMSGVKLTVSMESKKLSADGVDEIAFFVQTNLGEAPKPLSKTASGGELSRIMLSIQNVLADKEGISTMIFDEVDTGVSGRAAQKIGRKLYQAAQNRQVLAVTHLAQVAAFANHHMQIAKQTKDGRTFTEIHVLEPAQRVDEIARIIGGDTVTEASRANARELLENAGKPL